MDSTGSIDLRALRFFLGVYDAQNFSVVARREGVSASVVSRTILQLEDALEQQLFYRNTRAVIPTEAGRLFVDYARAIDSQFSDARQALQERSLQPSGLVRLNAPVFFGQRHIAPWLAGLSARYPLLEIELTLTDDYVDPHRTATDLIFRIGTLTDSSFHARVLGNQRYYLAAAPDYLARHGVIASPDALSEHHCLVYRGSAGANRWLFRRDGAPWVHYPVMPLLSSNNAETLL
ncbi:LysR substrate-binding domain-containing protein, partial [Pantoea septica]